VAAHTGAPPRLGLVVSRRVGGAVTRNRVKRLLRDWFRRHQAVLPQADIIIAARKGAHTLSYPEVVEELARVLLPPGVAGKNR
jgi:ribonuclease P protein component